MHQKEALLEESMVGANGASSRGADTYESLDLDHHFVLLSPCACCDRCDATPTNNGARLAMALRRNLVVAGKCWYLGEETE